VSSRASFPHRPYEKYQLWNSDQTIHFTVERAPIIIAIGVVRF
jgi:hypothetical protein